MSEMIERVAIAIRRNKFERNGRASVFDPSNISEEELGEARAAIEAMREPPVKIAMDYFREASGDELWRMFIDTALSEKP